MFSTAQRDAETASFSWFSRSRKQTPFDGAEGPRWPSSCATSAGRCARFGQLRLSEARGLAFAQALERLAGGVVLADVGLRVLHERRGGQDARCGRGDRPPARGAGVRRPRGSARPTAARQISGAAPQLAEVQFEASRQVSAPVAGHSASGPRGRGGRSDAAGAASIHRPRSRASTPPREPSIIAASFGLTPAEARVAALVATAAPTREVADRLGLSENTVKTHLKAVFLKTGARNRADLMRLMLGAAS